MWKITLLTVAIACIAVEFFRTYKKSDSILKKDFTLKDQNETTKVKLEIFHEFNEKEIFKFLQLYNDHSRIDINYLINYTQNLKIEGAENQNNYYFIHEKNDKFPVKYLEIISKPGTTEKFKLTIYTTSTIGSVSVQNQQARLQLILN